MSLTLKSRLAALFLLGSVFAVCAHATGITGAGSSFVYPVLSKWSVVFNQKTGHQINYQSIGSGGGIAQIKAGTVDFGASDAPLSAEDLGKFGLGQFPVVIGGIVPVVNVEGIGAGKLRLSGPVLAEIFMGKIKTWNDPALAQLNPGLKLPASAIFVVHRSDGSGTSYNFTNYLGKVSGEWQKSIGFGTVGAMAGGCGRQGQRGRVGLCQADQELDRLCRVRLCAAKQDGLHADGKRHRQVSAAEQRCLRRRCRDRGLGAGQGFQSDHDQCARSQRLA
ncbi:phosphate-binding periplasmic precursor (pbp) abc transporter protein, partial [mine drainage metagenome]